MPPEGDSPQRPDFQRIIGADKAHFDAARTRIKTPGTFPIEANTLRYMLIPEKILTLAPDPSTIGIVPYYHSDNNIRSFVVSNAEFPAIVDNQGKSRDPQAHSDIDWDWQKNDLIRNGLLNEHGEPLFYVSLGTEKEGVLRVFNYDDRHELHNEGIATSFYERLRRAAKELGFRFITGLNPSDRSLAFFKKSGRFSLDELNPEYLSRFDFMLEDSLDVESSIPRVTIDFLNPEDIPVFVKPSVLEQRTPNQQP